MNASIPASATVSSTIGTSSVSSVPSCGTLSELSPAGAVLSVLSSEDAAELSGALLSEAPPQAQRKSAAARRMAICLYFIVFPFSVIISVTDRCILSYPPAGIYEIIVNTLLLGVFRVIGLCLPRSERNAKDTVECRLTPGLFRIRFPGRPEDL